MNAEALRRRNADKLRARIDALGWSYVQAAEKLGLSVTGLHKQMRGERPIGRQTEIILALMETLHNATEAEASKPPRRRHRT